MQRRSSACRNNFNNKHPLVPLTTLRAGYRLVLHGLASAMLFALLARLKQEQQLAEANEPLAFRLNAIGAAILSIEPD